MNLFEKGNNLWQQVTNNTVVLQIILYVRFHGRWQVFQRITVVLQDVIDRMF